MRGLLMRGDVLGPERRRRWRDEDKVRIVSSVGVGGATVTQLAHHHEITRQQIYAWRHELKKKRLLPALGGMAFLPVDLSSLENGSAGMEIPAAPALVEVRLRNGRSLHFDVTLDGAILARLIQVVETA